MRWTKRDVEYLEKHYPSNLALKEILKKLGRSKRSICHKAVRLGLSRPKPSHNRPKNPNHRNEYDRKYYLRNQEAIYFRKLGRRKKLKEMLIANLGGKCSGCGYNRCSAALEFHHRDGSKESAISELLKNSSEQKILKEAEKCILLCANCHRELHNLGA